MNRELGQRETVFEKITASPETLAKVLSSIPATDGPWDKAFQRTFCTRCERENCDNCPNEEQRNDPLWWLETEAT